MHNKRKALFGLFLALVFVLVQVAAVSAAPLSQTGSITCTVTAVQITTNSSGTQVVQVACQDGTTYDLSVDSASNLGLVTTDTNGNLVVDPTFVLDTQITFDSTDLQADLCQLPDGANQPVGEALTSYFCKSGVDYNTLEGYHEAGMGYGVIAQACFMADKLGVTCQSILDAKAAQKTGDGFSFTVNGTEYTNWGLLRKDAFKGVDKSTVNLGGIMSGRISQDTNNTTDSSLNTTNDNGPQNSHAGGNGKGNGKGKGHGQGKP